MTATVNITVKMIDAATAEAKKIQAGMDQIAKAAKEAGVSQSALNQALKRSGDSTSTASTKWTELSSAISLGKQALNEVAQIAKQAYAVIKEGADIQLAETRFDRLAQSIGTTGDALNKQLAPAVGGLMSQAETMQLAGDLMSLGLAKTSEEAVRLTAVASALGMNMNQLVLTLTNQTTMRFDALGLAVDGFDAKVKTLEATGLSTDEAFKWAFIEQAEAQIERVGSVADTTAGELMKLEAGLADLKSEAATTAATFAGPVISKLNDSRDALALLNELFGAGAIDIGEYIKVQALLRTPLGDTEAILEGLQEKQEEYNRSLERGYDISYRYSGATMSVSNANWDAYRSYGDSANMLDFYGQRAANAEQANYNLGQSIRDAGSAQDSTNAALAAAGDFYSTMSTNVGSLTTALQEQLDFIAAGGGVAVALVNAANQALASGDFDLAQTLADQASIAAADVELELGKMDATAAAEKLAADLGIGFDEAKAMVADLQSTIFAMTAQTYVLNFVPNFPGVGAGGSYIPGVTGTGGSGSGLGKGGSNNDPFSYATGTGGWMKVPGPVGAPFPVTLHGGEPFNVMPAGQSPGGGGGDQMVIIESLVVLDGRDFDKTISRMNSKKASLGSMAGTGYAGT